MNHNRTLNGSCPTSINVAANSVIVTGGNKNKIVAVHASSIKTSKQINAPISNIISSRCSSLRLSKIGPHNDFDPKAFNPAKKLQKWSTRGSKLRGLSLPSKKPGAAVTQRTQPTSNASPPDQYPLSSDLPLMMTANVSEEDAFRPRADNYQHHRHKDLQRAPYQYQNCSALDFQVRTYVDNARDARPPELDYQIGRTLRRGTDALPFSSPSHARAMLTRLPIGSPLFVNGGREWTYGRLSGRFEDTAGDMCVIVVGSNGCGDVKDICNEIFKENHWTNCIMLVNWNAALAPSSFNASNFCNNTARGRYGIAPTLEGADTMAPSFISTVQGRPANSVSFQHDVEVHSPSCPPSHSAFSGSTDGARRIANVDRPSGNRGLATNGAAGIGRL